MRGHRFSRFFYSLVLNRSSDLLARAHDAIWHANNAVFRFANGKGGSTFSAIMIANQQIISVNIGDSRIYDFTEPKIRRLTVDDSLEEAVGGHGRDLLQFVGMGGGMQPHIKILTKESRFLAITTDGVHFVESSVFESILSNSQGLRQAADRLLALSRWCGGPDNASLAMIDLHLIHDQLNSEVSESIEISDPFGKLAIIAPSYTTFAHSRLATPRSSEQTQAKQPPRQLIEQDKLSRLPNSPQRKNNRLSKGGSKRSKKDVQLEIEIEPSTESETAEDDSR